MKQDGSGIHPAPNIQQTPDIYEIENLAADREMTIEAAMQRIEPWDGKTILDIGAGTGFHLPRFAARATRVIGVEPHEPSIERARARIQRLGLANVDLRAGSALDLPVQDDSIDIAHARFAYFFGPDCDPGLAELERVMKPGGVAFVIDNDLRGGTFAEWLLQSPWVEHDPELVEGYWRERGFQIERIRSNWSFDTRADLEAVINIEFPSELAERIIADHTGTTIEYHYLLIHRRY